MREANIELFGEDVINQTEEVYGLDEEGEIKGSYRPSGHPGVRLPFSPRCVTPTVLNMSFTALVRHWRLCRFAVPVKGFGT